MKKKENMQTFDVYVLIEIPFSKKHLSAPICLLLLPAVGSHARRCLTWAAMWAPHRSVGVVRTTAFGMTCGWSVYNQNVNMRIGRELIFTKPAETITNGGGAGVWRLLFLCPLWFVTNIKGEIGKCHHCQVYDNKSVCEALLALCHISPLSLQGECLILFSYSPNLDQYGSACLHILIILIYFSPPIRTVMPTPARCTVAGVGCNPPQLWAEEQPWQEPQKNT